MAVPMRRRIKNRATTTYPVGQHEAALWHGAQIQTVICVQKLWTYCTGIGAQTIWGHRPATDPAFGLHPTCTATNHSTKHHSQTLAGLLQDRGNDGPAASDRRHRGARRLPGPSPDPLTDPSPLQDPGPHHTDRLRLGQHDTEAAHHAPPREAEARRRPAAATSKLHPPRPRQLGRALLHQQPHPTWVRASSPAGWGAGHGQAARVCTHPRHLGPCRRRRGLCPAVDPVAC